MIMERPNARIVIVKRRGFLNVDLIPKPRTVGKFLVKLTSVLFTSELPLRNITSKGIFWQPLTIGYIEEIKTIKNTANGTEMTYSIVPEAEADLKEKKISVSSPIGKGLLGKSVGEIAEIQIPNGTIKFEVIKIEAA